MGGIVEENVVPAPRCSASEPQVLPLHASPVQEARSSSAVVPFLSARILVLQQLVLQQVQRRRILARKHLGRHRKGRWQMRVEAVGLHEAPLLQLLRQQGARVVLVRVLHGEGGGAGRQLREHPAVPGIIGACICGPRMVAATVKTWKPVVHPAHLNARI